MKSRRSVVVFLVIVVLAIFIIAFLGILFATSYVSLTDAMLEIMEDQKLVELVNEEDKEPDEEQSIIVNSVEGIDTDTYYKLLSLKWDELPSDIKPEGLGFESVPFSSVGWNVKAYLYAYMLAMEICLREEINPPGTKVVIEPEMLIGKWLSENAGTCIPGDTYLMWSDEVAASKVEKLNSSTCVGAFGMSNRWQNVEGSYDSGSWVALNTNVLPTGCLYISKLENPDLEDDKRAVIGKSNAFREASVEGLYYVTTDLYGNHDNMSKCEYSALAAALKKGQLPTEQIRKVQDRPNVAFLPDAMYSTALSVRLGIEGYTMDQVFSYGCSAQYLKTIQQYIAKIDDTNKQVVQEICIATAFQQFAGAAFCNGFANGSVYYKANMALIDGNISPCVTHNLNIGEAAGLPPSGAGNVARFVLLGDKDINTYDAVEWPNFINDRRISGGLWKRMYNALPAESRQDFVDALKSGYSKSEHVLYPNGYTGNMYSYQGYMTTGYSVLNVGVIMQMICPKLTEYTFAIGDYVDNDKYQSLRQSNASQFGGSIHLAGFINGVDCLGEDCICKHEKYHETPHTVAKNLPYDTLMKNCGMTIKEHYFTVRNITLQEAVDALKDAGAQTITAMAGDVKGDCGYNHKISNVQKPILKDDTDFIRMPLNYGTYPGHDGVDLPGYEGKSVTPIADGIVIFIGYNPFVPLYYNNADVLAKRYPAFLHVGDTYYGNFVIVLHLNRENEPWISLYAHLENFGHISVGSLVSPKTIIGHVGSTGNSTGPHLHLGIYPIISKDLNHAFTLTDDTDGLNASSYAIRDALEGE